MRKVVGGLVVLLMMVAMSAQGATPRTVYKAYSPTYAVSNYECGGSTDVCFALDNPRTESTVSLTIIDYVGGTNVAGTYFVQRAECGYGYSCTTTDISSGSFCGTANNIALPANANRVKVYVGPFVPSHPCGGMPRPAISGNVRGVFN